MVTLLSRKIIAFFAVSILFIHCVKAQSWVNNTSGFPLHLVQAILVDSTDDALVLKSAELLKQDLHAVFGIHPSIEYDYQVVGNKGIDKVILLGTTKSAYIQTLLQDNQLNASKLNEWESYQVKYVSKSYAESVEGIVIAGHDRRAVAYGAFELSQQMGVSPWYWWADVPVKKKSQLFTNENLNVSDAPKVKYRGIFLNDEAPALSGWTREKFGGFNHLFYEKVFELILRLKGNYLWPAMWGNAFYDDDPLNINSADQYGIVIGTSHHEPLMRAHDEWRRYGAKAKWDYDSSETALKDFWRKGMVRATNEKIVSVGMRGDGDKPMSQETATTLLEHIVHDQRQIIEEVTGKPASETPQLWALYKEVQDYYDKGMRVPDDITLLLCDDNWGNIRKLPKLGETPRLGGYGIYYHFDYVGGPRNYKWLNTNPLPHVWEQMHLAYEYNARQIWIVNVGDLKPMELPISFFLDYAWNPDRIHQNDIQPYTEQWYTSQFDDHYARGMAEITAKYLKLNGRRKPELLNEKTYSLEHYNEAQRVTDEYNDLLHRADNIYNHLPADQKDAYYQLILHPVSACANLQNLYTAVAKNQWYYKQKSTEANAWADKAKDYYVKDSLITKHYNEELAGGKWSHMMDQTHIGYTYWQQPQRNRMPRVQYVSPDSAVIQTIKTPWTENETMKTPSVVKKKEFFEPKDGVISLNASSYSAAMDASSAHWTVLPDLGRTADAITTMPVTSPDIPLSTLSPHLEYNIKLKDTGTFNLHLYFSPTLDFRHEGGLRYAISVDNQSPQVFSLNADDANVRIWEDWVANNIILKTSPLTFRKKGKHVIKFWMIQPGVVLEKLVLDLGGMKESYLGPPTYKAFNLKGE